MAEGEVIAAFSLGRGGKGRQW